MSKIKFFILFVTLLSVTFLFEACQKEEQSNVQLSDASFLNNKKMKANVNESVTSTNMAMLSGATSDDVLASIEDELNEKYGVPDQSIGEVSVSETELTVATQNGTISNEQAQQIYDTALSLWSQNYNSFSSLTKQALVVSLEVAETEGSNIKVRISTWVGKTQELGVTVGCNSNFPSLEYYWSSLYSKPASAVYGDKAIAQKFNQKAAVNYCKYFASPKKITFSATDAGAAYPNATQMNDAYCHLEEQISNALSNNPGYTLVSTDIVGKGLAGNTPYKYTGSFIIGIKKTKKICQPQKFPDPDGQ
jgi:hypothetical protein